MPWRCLVCPTLDIFCPKKFTYIYDNFFLNFFSVPKLPYLAINCRIWHFKNSQSWKHWNDQCLHVGNLHSQVHGQFMNLICFVALIQKCKQTDAHKKKVWRKFSFSFQTSLPVMLSDLANDFQNVMVWRDQWYQLKSDLVLKWGKCGK